MVATHRLFRRLFAVVAALAFAGQAAAQAPQRDPHYTRQTLIRVPFTPVTSGKLKRVLLYVSTDQGRDWQPCSEAAPTDRYFRDYIAPGDGTYWFAVRSLDTFDQYNPASLAQLVPEVKVIVDTKPPVVSLRQANDPRPGVVTVEWDVRDEHLDLSRFVVEYRVPGRQDWVRDDRAQPGTTGTLSWNVDPGLRMDVRLRAADRAHNVGDSTLAVGVGVDNRPLPQPPAGSSGTSGIHYLNSKTIIIPCRVTVGRSGRKDFDLWYTRDGGRSWTKAPKRIEGAEPNSPPDKPGDAAASPASIKLIFEADSDGLFGFVIVIRNGVGIGTPDPKAGDPPQFSVEVDTVEPKMQLKVTPGVGAEMRNTTVQWAAEDKNLIDRPVTLEYAEKKGDAAPTESDWKPLPNLTGPQDRSGIHVWTVGPEGPFMFLIRAKAVDKAKNTATETTKEPVIIDLEHPRVDIIGIEPGPKR